VEEPKAEPSLQADRLHAWRGERHVLRGLSFALSAGEALQLVGANGSGKTTLLRTIAALRPPEEGTVRWKGLDVRADRTAFHRELIYVGHEPALKADLTVLENLRYGIGVRRRVRTEDIAAAVHRLGRPEWLDRPARSLSAGQRRRVALCALLILDTPLWLLDEPTTNLDAEGQALVGELLESHLARGGIAVAAVHHTLGLRASGVRLLELDAQRTEQGSSA